MMLRVLRIAALLCALPVVAAPQESRSLSPAVLRAQSVECNYTAPEGQVQCTVRLHLKAQPGSALVRSEVGGAFASPLVGTDAAGHLLIGVFRGCESCMEQCLTLVYDFYTRPQGGWMEFNTDIHVRISTGSVALPPVAFNPRRAAALQVGGMSFFFTPLPAPEGDADAVYFRLEYEVSPVVRQIAFLREDGAPCEYRVLGGDYSARHDLTRATYLLALKEGDKACMSLHLFNPPMARPVPVRFRAYMGQLTDPDIGA